MNNDNVPTTFVRTYIKDHAQGNPYQIPHVNNTVSKYLRVEKLYYGLIKSHINLVNLRTVYFLRQLNIGEVMNLTV